MYPLGVWIIEIQNPFSDFDEETKNPFWIQDLKRALRTLTLGAEEHIKHVEII